MKKQNQAPMKSVEAIDTGTSNDVDPGILAFGTSVSVNDNLRRGIVHDIQQINANCSSIKEELSREKRIHDDIAKIKVQSNEEMLRLRQGASDSLDTMNMTLQVLLGLECTFKTELSVNHDAGQEQTGVSKDPHSHQGNKDLSKEIAELKETLTSRLKKQRDIRIKTTEKKNENNFKNLKIEEEFNGPLAKLQESDKLAQETLASERARIGSLKEIIKEVFVRNEQTKMLIETNIKNLAALKETWMKEVKEATESLYVLEEERHHEQSNLLAYETELKKLQIATDALKTQLDEAHRLQKDLGKIQADREESHALFCKLFTEIEELERENSLVRDKLDADRENYENLVKEKLLIEKKKEENDRREAETIIPSQAEMKELKAEKEQIDLFISTYISDGRIEMEQVTSEIVSNKNQILDLENELEIVIKDIDTKKSMLLDQKCLLEKYNDSKAQERSEIEKQIKEIVQQITEREMKMKHREEIKKQKIQNDEDELSKVERKLDILREGKRMLEKAARKGNTLLNSVPKA